jgi:hypothetical protein
LDAATFSQSASYGSGSVGEKLQQIISVKDQPYGAKGDGVTDDTAAIQAALNRGGKIVIPGAGSPTYLVSSANLAFIANTELTIERGAILLLSTTRLSAINVNDVQIHNHGVIKSTSLNITDSLPTNWQGRGIVEFGGTIASPAQRVGIDGSGEVMGDFVGAPGSGGAVSPTDRRRGILFSYVINAWAKFNNVHGTFAEAILYNGTTPTNDKDVDIIGNKIHDCNHDGISGIGTGITSFKTRSNTIWTCAIGIECQYGDHQHNFCFGNTAAGYAFGGNSASDSVSPVIYANNTGIGNGTAGSTDFDLEGATSAGGVVIVENNTSYNSGAFGFFVTFAKTAIITGNKAYGWGASAVGSGIATANNTTVLLSGNSIASEGANSNGGYNIGGGTTVWGLNDYSGVATPYLGASSPYLKVGAPTGGGIANSINVQGGYYLNNSLLLGAKDTSISTGVGVIHMKSANPATNAAWVPITSADGTVYFVPGWTTNSP